MIEPLEPRALFSSATLFDTTLVVRGDPNAANNISVGFDRRHRVIVVLNGVGFSFKKDSVVRIDLIGGSQNDSMRVSEARGEFSISTNFFSQGGNDTLVGGSEDDFFACTSGNESISTGNGDDTVLGGSGSDTIVGGNDFKLIFGGRGNNTIAVGSGRGYIFGGHGDNLIDTSGDRFEVFGREGNDILSGHGHDTLWGGDGKDVLRGGVERHFGQFGDLGKLMRILTPGAPTIPTS